MQSFYSSKVIERSRRSCKIILSALWSLGLICGIMAATGAGNLTSLMHAYCQSRVSIVSLLIVPLLPFLLSAYAVYFSDFRLLFVLSFLKAFSFGFCAWIVTCAFGGAGWLVRGMLLFTDLVTLPVLWLYWIRCADGSRLNIRNLCTGCLLWYLVVVLFDYACIAPLLRQIL